MVEGTEISKFLYLIQFLCTTFNVEGWLWSRSNYCSCITLCCCDCSLYFYNFSISEFPPETSCTSFFFIVLCNIMSSSQMKHQLDATLCRFYFCRVILHVSGASAHHQFMVSALDANVDVCWRQLLLSAYLIVPDGCIRSVQFSFDVLGVVYLSCLFGIAKF